MELSISRLTERHALRYGLASVAAAVALAGCGESKPTGANQAHNNLVEAPNGDSSDDTLYGEPLDDSQEVPETIFSSPVEAATAFAKAFAEADSETICLLRGCDTEIESWDPIPEMAPTSAEVTAQSEVGATVELQMDNPKIGKWCVFLAIDAHGRWRVERANTPPPGGPQKCN